MKILAFCGSLRKKSLNNYLLKEVIAHAPEGVEIEEAVIENIPLYNEDIQPQPQAVLDLKQKVRDADAILFVSPEYNYSVPGLLKNALDWLSRPPADNPFNDKPAGIMGVSIGMIGTARMQYHLRQILIFVNAHVLNKPEMMVPLGTDKFDADGHLTDEKTKEKAVEYINALVEWTKRIQKS